MPKITVLGTGLMGYPMSVNVRQAGYDVTVWNRSPEKAAALAGHGAQVAQTAGAAVAGADYVISMLADGRAVAEVFEQAQAGLSPTAVWIDMSSTKPAEARSLYHMLNGRFLDAPVSGGTKGAQEASLAIMVGGDATVFDAARPVLSSMGRPTHVGPAGTGQLAKLANQAIVGITISAVAEAMLLLEKGGADPAAVRAALKGGFADGTILQQHGARMSKRDFTPGGLTRFQVKDLDNVLAEAATLNLTLPATQDVRDRFAHLCQELGGADKDHSALFLELLDRNGL